MIDYMSPLFDMIISLFQVFVTVMRWAKDMMDEHTFLPTDTPTPTPTSALDTTPLRRRVHTR